MANDIVDDALTWANEESKYLKTLTPAERVRRLARYGILTTESDLPTNTTITIPFDNEKSIN